LEQRWQQRRQQQHIALDWFPCKLATEFAGQLASDSKGNSTLCSNNQPVLLEFATRGERMSLRVLVARLLASVAIRLTSNARAGPLLA